MSTAFRGGVMSRPAHGKAAGPVIRHARSSMEPGANARVGFELRWWGAFSRRGTCAAFPPRDGTFAGGQPPGKGAWAFGDAA
jgi:hypothetical protein